MRTVADFDCTSRRSQDHFSRQVAALKATAPAGRPVRRVAATRRPVQIRDLVAERRAFRDQENAHTRRYNQSIEQARDQTLARATRGVQVDVDYLRHAAWFQDRFWPPFDREVTDAEIQARAAQQLARRRGHAAAPPPTTPVPPDPNRHAESWRAAFALARTRT